MQTIQQTILCTNRIQTNISPKRKLIFVYQNTTGKRCFVRSAFRTKTERVNFMECCLQLKERIERANAAMGYWNKANKGKALYMHVNRPRATIPNTD